MLCLIKMYKKRTIPDNVRQLCYARDNNGQCQFPDCTLSREYGDRVNLHHIKNEQFGGAETPDNLTTLCDIHHKAMHVEFHAFYPDSETVLRKMIRISRQSLSVLRSFIGVDDALDLKPYLFYLTKSATFRDGQLEAIRASLKGQDVLLVTPTGTGKSVCYQLPGLMADHPSLVVSPLKALMVDQVRSIWSKMIPATYINGDLGEGERRRRYEFIGKKLYKFIFAAPERFYGSTSPATSRLYTKYSYLVIDEAHAIDSWGMAFRPSYRKLGQLREDLQRPRVIALTATASKKTQGVILDSLGIPDAKVIVTGFYKDNITIYKRVVGQSINSKYEYLRSVIDDKPADKVLVFVPTVKQGEELLEQLRSDYYEVEFYHGKLDTKSKMDIQARFTNISEPRLKILICTSAFGMGIDIPDIRKVVHWSPALSLTEYTQQIGRAGRDRQSSEAHLLADGRDRGLLEFMATRATQAVDFKDRHGYSDDDVVQVEQQLKEQVSDMMLMFEQADGAEWQYILNYFGETPLRFWKLYGKKITDAIFLCLIVIGIISLLASF